MSNSGLLFNAFKIAGTVFLALCLLVIFDGIYNQSNAATSLLATLRERFGLLGENSADWALRSSIALPIIQALEVPVQALALPSLRSVIVATHQASLVVGLGAAFFLDIYLLQFLRNRIITSQTLEIVKFGSRLVSWGLVAIWITAAAILFYYYRWAPELLSNPKVWAKLVIVVVLTVNGMFIHRFAFNNLKNCVGKSILDQGMTKIATNYLPMITVSVVSWAFAFLLGAFKELNNAYEAQTIVMGYLVVLAAVYILLLAICSLAKGLTRSSKLDGFQASIA